MWMDDLVISIHSLRHYDISNSLTGEYLEGEELDQVADIQQNLSRTQLLLLDYKQFKAARLIQRIFRGWHVRNELKKQRKAALIIQRNWRRYRQMHNMIVEMQELTQSKVLIAFNSSCIKIQALFRGWYSRKYINNMLYLKNIQMSAVEDILHSIIYKLHTMKRLGQLPGIATFREPETLNKVEDFMSTMTYRLYNRYVGRKWAMSKTIIEKHRADFKNSISYTWAPYFGNDHINVCNIPPPPKAPKTYERREYDVTQTFMACKRQFQDHKSNRPTNYKRSRSLYPLPSNHQLFCKDLIHSMKHWTLDDNQKLNIPDNILNGNNLSGFLKELRGYLTARNFLENCDCLRDSLHLHKLTPRIVLE